MRGMKQTCFNVSAAVVLGAVVLAGCGEGGEDPAAEMRRLQETPGATAAPTGAPVVVASLAWDVPVAWEASEPTSDVRKAQFRVGDDGEVVFFAFGAGQGGDVESNLARWARSVTDEGGAPVQPEIEVFESGALRTVSAVYEGTYMAGPPGGERTPMAGWALLGAVVEGGDEGSVFIRFAGPAETVRAARDDWDAMLAGVRGAGL